jgi:hypothetical protein
MAITASDLKIYLSGGAGNSDPNASLGGVISSTEVTDNTTHNLFDQVSGTESNAGDTEYRGVYLKNTHGTLTLQNTKIYISSNTGSADTTIDIALDGGATNATMETLTDESTAPSGETFSAPTTYAGGLSIGSLAAGEKKGLFIRRTVNAGAAAVNDDAVTIKYDGDTAA